MGDNIRLKSQAEDGFEFGAYHAPAEGERRGGLVLIQEAFGVTAGVRHTCDGFAADGYEVIAPQMFDRFQRDFEIECKDADFATLRAWMDASWTFLPGDVQACVDALAQPVFITGFCYGGGAAWLTAARCSGLKASSAFYGGAIAGKFLGETPQIPTILHWGAKDAHIGPDQWEAIRTAHPDVPQYVYDADHGFFAEDRPGYDPAIAGLARRRTLGLFEAFRA